MIVYSGPGEFSGRYFQENDQRSETRIFTIAKYCGGKFMDYEKSSCISNDFIPQM
jgi:hypothetical protein